MATPTGLYSSLPRDIRGNQTRISELFKADALRADDVFLFIRHIETLGDNGHSHIPVNAKAVVRAEDNAAVKGAGNTVDFDVVEDGQRSFLGAFTGPKTLAETLTRRTGGLRKKSTLGGLNQAWEDFQVWRNGVCLGTAADVRNHYYITHKIGVAPRTREKKNTAVADVTTATPNPTGLDETQNASVITRSSLTDNQALADIAAAALEPLDFEDARDASVAPPTEKAKLATPANATAAATNRPAFSDALSHPKLAYPAPPPKPPAALPTHAKPNIQCEQVSDPQPEDILMRGLFDAVHPSYQPERYSKKHTAICAKDYIRFLEHRLNQTYGMITRMGVTPASLTKMIGQMNDGADVADAMRNALEWEEDEAPLGNPLGRFDCAQQKFDVEMEDAE